MAQAFAKRLSPTLVGEQGTAIGKALQLATLSFSSQSEQSRVIVLITDGENGFIVPTKDSAVIADAIMKIMSSRELYERLSDGAIDRYHKDFTSQVMTDRVMELYEKSVARWRK